MIDLNLLRENPKLVIDLTNKKDPNFNINELIDLDVKVRQLKINIDDLRNQKNKLADQAKSGVTDEIRENSAKIKEELKEKEGQLIFLDKKFTDLYLRCPNIISQDVPEGNKEENVVVKIVGKKPEFNFTPRNHVELGKINNWFDFEAAARMTGSNFALYKGEAVKLVYNLMIFMLNNNIKHGFNPVLPPYLVNEKALRNASNFPRFQDEVYAISEDKLYLTPTSEVNLTNIYADQILSSDQLPINMTSWTSCFRREAGNYGAHERGLIRIHQFEKCELYTICDPKDSDKEQKRMLDSAESILNQLGLHYRISLLAAQDCSFASSKTYDIEVWMPGQNVYKEVSSISNCTDFQSRRSEIRFRSTSSSKPTLVHTLNGSSLALPRLMVALMETYQKENGSIELPATLKNIF